MIAFSNKECKEGLKVQINYRRVVSTENKIYTSMQKVDEQLSLPDYDYWQVVYDFFYSSKFYSFCELLKNTRLENKVLIKCKKESWFSVKGDTLELTCTFTSSLQLLALKGTEKDL